MNEDASIENVGEFSWREQPLADCEFKNFHIVADYWNSVRKDRLAPAWKEIDLLTFSSDIVTHICVIDTFDGLPFPYRFFGTSMASLHKLELTNKTTAEIRPLAYRDACVDQYQKVVERKSSKLFVGTLHSEDGLYREHHNLRLPLSNDGQNVSNILTIEHFSQNIGITENVYSDGT